MTKREQLKLNIKQARQAKKVSHQARAEALNVLRGCRENYNTATGALEAAEATLVAFDNGEILDNPVL